MSRMNDRKKTYEIFSTFVKRFQGIHISIGLLGNAAFFAGSIFFLYEQRELKLIGAWLFIIGSFGMLLGSLGRAVLKFEEIRERKEEYEGPMSNYKPSA